MGGALCGRQGDARVLYERRERYVSSLIIHREAAYPNAAAECGFGFRI
jgi:hypothetical protein